MIRNWRYSLLVAAAAPVAEAADAGACAVMASLSPEVVGCVSAATGGLAVAVPVGACSAVSSGSDACGAVTVVRGGC